MSGLIQAAQPQIFTTSLNLNQAAATYDIATASGEVIIVGVALRVGTAAGGLTSVSIQTNDTTPFEIMSAATGAIGNLTAQRTIITDWLQANPWILSTGKKLQYTIVGAGNAGTIACSILFRQGALS